MGNLSYLTGKGNNNTISIHDSIYNLENTSILFCEAWQSIPPDFDRAARVSVNAMEHLDHIVNEILRARDTKKANQSYIGSSLEAELNTQIGEMFSPVTSIQQQLMVSAGPGNGKLPGQATKITLEKLLNKIKHRHHLETNFRIDSSRHIFVINVNKPNQNPDSIVEFDVRSFCNHCKKAAQHL